MSGRIKPGDLVRDEWGVHEVAKIEDTTHGRLLKLRLGDDEYEPFAWIGEAFVELVGEHLALFREGER